MNIIKDEIPSVFLNEIGEDFEIMYPKQGYTSSVAVVEGHKGTFVIKRATGEWFKKMLKNEIKVLNSLPQLDVFVPKIILNSEDEFYIWCLMDYVKGVSVRSALENETCKKKKHEIIYNYGKALGAIHAKTYTETEDKIPWLKRKLEEAEFNMKNFTTEGDLVLLEQLKLNTPLSIPNTLIHGDYTIDNVLIYNTEVSGVIDWSAGGWGDPRYDISVAIRPKNNIFQTTEEVDIFYEGYKGRRVSKKEFEFFQDGGLYDFF